MLSHWSCKITEYWGACQMGPHGHGSDPLNADQRSVAHQALSDQWLATN